MTTLFAKVPSTEHTFHGHPENAGRVLAILQLLEERGALYDLVPVEPTMATVEQLTRVHTPGMVERVRSVSSKGGGRLDADTYATSRSYDLARLAAGTTCAAAAAITNGVADNGIAVVRPPGHHAETDRVGGFCLFNNVAVAARHLQSLHGIKRVLVIDFDVHHGNGTQQIFYDDPTVLFVSLHLYHPFFYPGTGGADEIGRDSGIGANLNVPFAAGAGDMAYAKAFEELIQPMALQFDPDFILVSAGFDAHWIDPLASATLSLAGYSHIARKVKELADELCQGRALFVLEGGYDLAALSYGVLNLTYVLTNADVIADPLGPSPVDEQDMSKVLRYLEQIHLRK